MRIDNSQGISAEEWINTATKKEIPIYQTNLSNETFTLQIEGLYSSDLKDHEYEKRIKIINQLENDKDKEEKMKLLNRERYNL